MRPAPIDIVVLMGGTSPEREVSLRSGAAITDALVSLGHRPQAIDYTGNIFQYQDRFQSADLVFLALHGGDGESGQVQAVLEEMGVRFTGTGPLGSALCMDKHLSKAVISRFGIPTPEWVYLTSPNAEEIPLDLPVVVKPNSLGSTIGLTVVEEKRHWKQALDTAFAADSGVLVERFIPGRELTVTILDSRALPIVEIKPSHGLYDYDCKYTSGMSTYDCPADLSKEQTRRIQKLAESMFHLCRGRHYARIDFRLDPEGNPWCLEMNTLPGMTATSLVPKAAAAAGMDFETLVQNMVDLALHG
ncbi:MAG: D-alanine--D-alanine ligase [Candidatus Neomarinimicrobiota bacterium]|nr:MAG: D-alanine--D-alanine ligase [Candidatus Neomarinimicrobiota bacterium]